MNSALDDFNAEMDFNVEEAELKVLIVLTFDGQEYPVNGIYSHAWKRLEKDGRLDPGSPMLIPSVVITTKTLRGLGIGPNDYKGLTVTVNGEEMSVDSYEDANPVRLFLKSDLYELPDPEPDDPEPPVDPDPNPDPDPDPDPYPDWGDPEP